MLWVVWLKGWLACIIVGGSGWRVGVARGWAGIVGGGGGCG